MALGMDEIVVVDWLARDQDLTEGIDHLGIQVVSTNVYARLLPGISNLTDRARYFSFYPWVLDSFARRSPSKAPDDWRRWIRRHEFTFSAASVAAEGADKIDSDAAGGVIGARAARRILNKEGATTIDIDGATRLENGKAAKGTYFKNREGGYDQYYKNQMTVLGLMRHDEERKAPDRRLTKYAGEKLGGIVEKSKAFRDLIIPSAAKRSAHGGHRRGRPVPILRARSVDSAAAVQDSFARLRDQRGACHASAAAAAPRCGRRRWAASRRASTTTSSTSAAPRWPRARPEPVARNLRSPHPGGGAVPLSDRANAGGVVARPARRARRGARARSGPPGPAARTQA